MNYFLFVITLSLALTVPHHSSQAALTQIGSPKAARICSKDIQYGLPFIVERFKRATQGDIIFVDQFRLRNLKVGDVAVLDLLKKQALSGVTVEVVADKEEATTRQEIESLRMAKVAAYAFNSRSDLKKSYHPVNMHDKVFGCTNTKVDKETKEKTKKYYLLSGSQNLTFQSPENQELMLLETTYEQFQAAYEAHQALIDHETKKAIIKNAQKKILTDSPKTPKRLSSLEYDLCASIAPRLKKADGQLWINIYNQDHNDILDAQRAALDEGALSRLTVDATCLKSEANKKFLVSCAQQGVDVRIYNPSQTNKFWGKYPLINHAKFFIRKNSDGSTMVGIGSVNFTNANNSDINHWTFYPNDPEITQQAENAFEQIQKSCIKVQDLPAFKSFFVKNPETGLEKALEKTAIS